MEKIYLKKHPLNKEGVLYTDFFFNVMWNQFDQLKQPEIQNIDDNAIFVIKEDKTIKKSRRNKLLEEFSESFVNRNPDSLLFKVPEIVKIDALNFVVIINPSKFLFDSKISKKYAVVFDPLNEKLHLVDKKDFEATFSKFKIGSVMKKGKKWTVLSVLKYKEMDMIDLQVISEIVSTNLLLWEKNNTSELCEKCRKECKQNLGFELFKCDYFTSTRGRKSKESV